MTMQYGATKYTPFSPNGNWTSLCQIAAQARSIGYGTSRPDSLSGDEIPNFQFLRNLWEGKVDVPNIGTVYNSTQKSYSTTFMNNPSSYMSGTKYFDSASAWYPSLQQDAAGRKTNTDFLTDYFFSAMQVKAGSTSTGTPIWSTALSGSNSIKANVQIFEKSSTYFVATTHAMYYLELAEEALKKNDIDAAKNHFDSIAAIFFGCGDTNPVPLPVYTPDTVVTTAPQVATQITWTADASKKDGSGGTLYSLYHLANKRASNYGKCGTLKTSSCSTDKVAQTTTGSVPVADLNTVVSNALSATGGPTAAGVSSIRDSINTINAQAAQRYMARMSLAANNPGNGLGGSTKRIGVTGLPANAANNPDNTKGLIPTACGGGMYQTPGSKGYGANPTMGTAGEQGHVRALAPATSTTDFDVTEASSTVAGVVTGLAPAVNAQCGQTANATGTVMSNTATMESVMNLVSSGTTKVAPYTLKGETYTGRNNGAAEFANTNKDIIAATRGKAAYDANVDYTKATPLGCIGTGVYFSDVLATVDTAEKAAYEFCNPEGLVGVALASNDVAANTLLYTQAGTTNNPWVEVAIGTAGTSAAITDEAVIGKITKVWDPIMAAQLTEGGFCCNALYYSTDGVGRSAYTSGGTSGGVTYKGTGSISSFTPPLSGGNMVGEDSPGGMCPAHSKGDGYSTKTDGSAALTNPAMVELLEGQAFYAALAPSQYSLPTTSTTATTQAARAAKQRKCADAITSMMKLNKKAKVDAAAGAFGFSYSAVEFPLWKVGIGAGSSPTQYTVPNGYCYANACFEDFASIGTQSTFKGTEKFGELVSGPNMGASKTGEACGLANSACATPPTNWNGGPAVMATCWGSDCTAAGILNTTGAIPVA